jgi:hypothetical protein
MPTLLAGAYPTDKSQRYLDNYEIYFRSLADHPIKLLELGVRQGGSLLMWRDYFARGVIAGLDAEAVTVPDDSGRVRVFQGLQQDKKVLSRIAQEVAPSGFDIIIDDASHIAELSRITFWHLFENHLKCGGLFVIEDWGTGYWDSWPDGKCYTPPPPPKQNGFSFLTGIKDFFLPKNRTAGSDKEQHKLISHSYGMVGFVKELIDECGMEDITHPAHGVKPLRMPQFESMMVTHGQVFIRKKNSDQEN